MKNAKHRDPKLGRLTARVIRSLVASRGSAEGARAFCAGRSWDDSISVDHVLKGAVAAGDSSAVIATTLGFDLLPLVREVSVIDRLPAARRVPVNTRMLTQISGATAGYVAEGGGIPVAKMTFTGTSLDERKIGAIIPITAELARSSSPDADAMISNELASALGLGGDSYFLDGGAASATRPASVLNGATSLASSGATLTAVDSDLAALEGAYIAAGGDPATAVYVMAPATALSLSRLRGSGGAAAFPDIGATGGAIHGISTLTSRAAASIGSPTSNRIALIDGAGVRVGDPSEIEIEVSTEAAIELLDNPAGNSITPTATTMVSMMQVNGAAVRALRVLTWARDGAACFLHSVPY